MFFQPGHFLKTVSQWVNRTARRRLVTWSVGFLVVSIIVLSIIFWFVGQRQVLNDTGFRNTQMASSISRDINAQISNITGNARTFTRYMGALSPDLETQAGALLGLRLSSVRYRALCYFNAGGALLLNLADTTDNLLAVTPAELTNRAVVPAGAQIMAVYSSTIKTGTSISDVYYTALDYAPVIDIGMPVIFSAGNTRVVVFEIDLTDIWQKISMSTIGETGITYAVSHQGQIIAHPQPAFIGRPMPDEIRPVLNNLEGSAQFVDPLTKQSVIAAYSPVGGQTGWGIIVQQDRAEINASIVKTGTTIIIVLLILGFIGLAIILLLINSFTRPIKELTETVKNIARTGNLTKTPMLKRPDELGQLSQAFDQMIDKVKATEDKLSISEERYKSLFQHANDAILLIDKTGIIDCNKKAEEMFGASRDQIIHKLPSEISPEIQADGLSSRAKEQQMMELAYAGQEQHFEWRHRKPNGESFEAEVGLNRLNIDNQLILMAVVRDITDRKRAEEALKQAQKEKEEAAVAERTRLARDLHDAVSQTLFSAGLIAEVLPRIWEKNREEGRRRLEEIRQLTRGALAEMRTLLFELRPAALADAELSYLLHQLAESITGRSRIPVEVFFEGECNLAPEAKVALYRITQEALNNVAKHAHANQARVNVSCKPDAVSLVISDNGQGFDIARVHPESLGLGIMRERARGIGAELQINSQIGAGSEIIVKVSKSLTEVQNENARTTDSSSPGR
jgi:PAS domain S-box-containing protein